MNPTDPITIFAGKIQVIDKTSSRQEEVWCQVDVNAERTEKVVQAFLIDETSGDQTSITLSRIITSVNSSQLPRLLAQSPNSFNIKIKKQNENYHLTFEFNGKDYVAASEKPKKSNKKPKRTPKPQVKDITVNLFPHQHLDFLSIKDVRDLAVALKEKKQDPLLHKITQIMVTRFSGINHPNSDHIQEIVRIAEHLKPEALRTIVQSFLSQIKEEVMLTKDYLIALSDIFRTIQRANYQKTIEEAISSGQDPIEILQKNPLYQFTANDLVAALNLLKEKLDDTTLAKSKADNSALLIAQLNTYIALLELMVMAEVKGIDRKKHHEPFYDTINRFSYDGDLTVAYLAEYGKQLLTDIKDNETHLHECFRRVFHVVKAFTALLALVPKEAGFDFSAVPEAITNCFGELKKAFTFQDSPQSRFNRLIGLRQAILGKDVRCLSYFKAPILVKKPENSLASISLETAKEWHTHDPFFLKGFIEILTQVIIHYGSTQPDVGKTAFLLLEQICIDNFKNKKGPFSVEVNLSDKASQKWRSFQLFVENGHVIKLKNSYSKQIVNEILVILREVENGHPSLAMRELAKASLAKLTQIDPIQTSRQGLNSSSPKLLTNFPVDIFFDAVQEIAPWRLGIQQVRINLEVDPQLKHDRNFYLPTYAKQDSYSQQEKKLDLLIAEFLKSQNKVLLITAPMGYGKSLSVKSFAAKLWNECSSHEGYLPFFASLPGLNDPYQAIEETLGSELASIPYLKGRQVVWILDAFDELKEGNRTNLYVKNQFHQWEQAKLIVTSRDGMTPQDEKNLRPDPAISTGLQKISIVPFDQKRIPDYLNQYLDVCKKQQDPLIWTSVDEYMHNLKQHPEIGPLLERPLFLRIFADTFPQIFELSKKAQKKPQIQEQDLLDAFFCRIVERELSKFALRYRNADLSPPSKEAFLRYHLDLAKAIQALGWIRHPELRGTNAPKTQTWFSLKDPDTKIVLKEEVKKKCGDDVNIDLNQSLQAIFEQEHHKLFHRCGLIVRNKDKWGFGHEQFYEYFLTINMYGREKDVLNRLNNDEHEFGQLFARIRVYD